MCYQGDVDSTSIRRALKDGLRTCWTWPSVSCGHMLEMSAEKGPPNTGTCCVVGVEGAAAALYRPSSSPTIISFFFLLSDVRPHCVPLFSSSSESSSDESPATTGAKGIQKNKELLFWREEILVSRATRSVRNIKIYARLFLFSALFSREDKNISRESTVFFIGTSKYSIKSMFFDVLSLFLRTFSDSNILKFSVKRY